MKMEIAKIFLVLMGVVALSECQRSASIQCFQCNTGTTGEEDCADPFDASMQDKYRKGCSAGAGSRSTTCVKIVTGSTVMRSCNTPVNASCGEPVVENPSGTFTYCCTGDSCNSAGQVGTSVALAAVSMLLANFMFQL
ncbi:uncharacterized protein LOC119730469 [Patiria miniata]|uniref:Uncharacterized protein n=1 Tax=Patiria miniata TaxID=46514 RepID=A0A914A7C3_PATMI|nr:uncharacterized protein LOC119730469 [Patiria miniata]XP_038059317.1 uncharacterized protein LOC119730469 [Patiria miniata]